jgi:hypothetical protein
MNAVTTAWISAAVVLLATGCTVIHIEGNGNTVSDAGGHGGGVTLPGAQPSVVELLRTP